MDLSAHMNRAILTPAMKNMRRMDYVYASALGFATPEGVRGGCRRAEYYRMMGFEPDRLQSADNRRQAVYGGAIGDTEVELAKQARIYVADEVTVLDAEHKISGRIDLVVVDPEANSDPYVGIELKSIHGYYSTKGTVDPGPHGTFIPKDGHLAQTAFYAWCYRASIKSWKIRYLCRDTGRTRDHDIVIPADGAICANGINTGFSMDQLFAWSQTVIDCIRQGAVPERDYWILWDKDIAKAKAMRGELSKSYADKAMRGYKIMKGDFQCKYCRSPHRCWHGEQLPYNATVQDILDV